MNQLESVWNDLENKFLDRANRCYEALSKKVTENTEDVIAKLQYEAGHSSSPKKWWNKDYPYRLKVELANMSIGIDNTISRIIATDARWFNQMLDQKFKTYVQV